MATSGTSFARAIEGIPVVANTAARNARFKNPEVDQRVQNRETGYIERWDGGLWVREIALRLNVTAAQTDVEIIAHRGYYDFAPENTMPAFTAAAGRAHSIEFDVQCTSDGYPMVIHDNTVDRTTNGTGDVFTFTRAGLEALDAGSKFDARWTGTRIPRLDDVLKVGAQGFRYVYPEIKRVRPGQQVTDIQTIVQAVKDAGLEERCVMQSFNGASDFPVVRRFSQRITLGYLVSGVTAWNAALPLAAADGNAAMLADYNLILANPGFVAAARAQGVDVAVWVVNTTENARQLAALGVTRLMSNTLSHTWAAR